VRKSVEETNLGLDTKFNLCLLRQRNRADIADCLANSFKPQGINEVNKSHNGFIEFKYHAKFVVFKLN